MISGAAVTSGNCSQSAIAIAIRSTGSLATELGNQPNTVAGLVVGLPP